MTEQIFVMVGNGDMRCRMSAVINAVMKASTYMLEVRMRKITAFLLMILISISTVSCFNEKKDGSDTEPDDTSSFSASSSDGGASGKDPEQVNTPDYARFENIPQIYVDCFEGAEVLSKEFYVDCCISVDNCSDGYAFDDVKAGIRVRGNSTSGFGDEDYARRNQVPYRIKFEKKQSMLGLNNGAKCKSWVLLKPHVGHAIALTLGRKIISDDGYYCSDCQYVELYLNNEYKGLYLLAEQCQINENRVDVYETPEGYTGIKTGYLLELNNYPEKDDVGFATNFGDVMLADIEGGRLSLNLKTDGINIHKRTYTLKNDNISAEQRVFIRDYINNLFYISYNAIIKREYYELSEDFTCVRASTEKNAKELIGRYIDIDSLVDMYLLQEISMNTDVGAGSFYLSVDLSDGASNKLTFECPWDFDWAFSGNSRYTTGKESYVGLSAATFCSSDFLYANTSGVDRSNPWLILFMRADWFRKAVYDRFCELETSGAFDVVYDAIDYWNENYSEAFLRNKEKWSYNVSKELTKNKTWLVNRIDWLGKKLKSISQ